MVFRKNTQFVRVSEFRLPIGVHNLATGPVPRGQGAQPSPRLPRTRKHKSVGQAGEMRRCAVRMRL